MDNLPQLKRIAGGGIAFLHPCFCGARGSFGRDVALLKGKPGTWRCFAHRFVASPEIASVIAPAHAPAAHSPAPKPVDPAPVYATSDLFDARTDDLF